MLKKVSKYIVATTFALSGAAIMLPTQASAVELKFVHGYSTAAQHHRNVQWYTEEVTKRTDGEVTFKIYPAAQLMPINQELPAILSGQVSMTYSVAPVVASVEPLWGVFDLPFLFDVETDDMDRAAEFFNDENGGGLLGKKMEERGFKLITIAPTDWLSSFYLSKPKTVTKIDDLKGLKIRNTGGEIANKTGEVFGYNPIAVAGAELVPALTQGVVDGGILPPIFAYDNKLPLKGINIAPFSWPAVTPIIMSLAEFEKLTPEQQKIMMEVGKDLQAHAQEIVEKGVSESIEKLQDGGATVSTLSDEDIKIWRERAQSLWQDFSTKYGDDGKKLVDTASSLIQ